MYPNYQIPVDLNSMKKLNQINKEIEKEIESSTLDNEHLEKLYLRQLNASIEMNGGYANYNRFSIFNY